MAATGGAGASAHKPGSWINLSSVSVGLFMAYVGFVGFRMYHIMNPLLGIEVSPDEATVDPLWKQGTLMSADCYLTASRDFYAQYLNRSHPLAAQAPLVASFKDLAYDWDMERRSVEVNVTTAALLGAESAPNVTVVPHNMWNALLANRTLYLHVLVTAQDVPTAVADPGLWMLRSEVPLVKHGPRPKPKPRRRLVGRVFAGPEARASEASSPPPPPGDLPTYIPFWKPEVGVRFVTDFTRFPEYHLPESVARSMEIVGVDAQGRQTTNQHRWQRLAYKPILHADEIGLTSDKYVPINDTLQSLPLKITAEPMSLQRWQLMQALEGSLQQQKEAFGFGDSDIDDLRRLISDTNVYLLGVTILASCLHLLFEFLAFKSDVQFWKQNKSLVGLSVRTLFMEVVFQTVILLSLIEQDASLLVTVPSGVGLVIQMWKCQRATGLRLTRNGLAFTRLQPAASTPTTTTTAEDTTPPLGGKAGGNSNNPASQKQGPDTPRPTPPGAAADTGAAPTSRAGSGGGGGGSSGGGGSGRDGSSDGNGDGGGDEGDGTRRRRRRKKAGGGASADGDAEGSVVSGDGSSEAGVGGADKAAGAGGVFKPAETLQYDRVAIVHLSLLLLPLVAGYAVRKLLMDEHEGWYNWALQSMTGFVYMFGFILMTPQLYINYKLRSVAHLPWRFLCYRTLSTVIDDLFAFVIRMPTMHRLSCFRDDVVFVVYIYQRWIYPVDASRPQDRGA